MEGPTKTRRIPYTPQDSPIHIQLPQPVTDTYKLVYISHQARGDSDSGERSPADSQGIDIHPGPALRKAHSLEHLDFEATGGPESREHSLAKFCGTTLPGPACSLKSSTAHKESPAHGGPDSRDCSTAKSLKGVDSSSALRSMQKVAHKDNPACGGLDSRDHSTAHPSGLTNPSDPAEGNPPKQGSDHPPKSPPNTPPVPTPQGKSERLEVKLTPLQKRRLKNLKTKGKTTKVSSSLPTLDTTSKNPKEIKRNPTLHCF